MAELELRFWYFCQLFFEIKTRTEDNFPFFGPLTSLLRSFTFSFINLKIFLLCLLNAYKI